jgi:hypothetical protein
LFLKILLAEDPSDQSTGYGYQHPLIPPRPGKALEEGGRGPRRERGRWVISLISGGEGSHPLLMAPRTPGLRRMGKEAEEI